MVKRLAEFYVARYAPNRLIVEIKDNERLSKVLHKLHATNGTDAYVLDPKEDGAPMQGGLFTEIW